ncbi:extracellular solute-binding protein [Nocardioides panzhihuensis]|uniref:Sorbitol/mannitol transport system substrate-binding protein n=1 Tax=Nocardioides panzhihuensis TaxID=860243 RepID=A0A7Z0DP97_9ACTN|nr:extracellular solute-binding protein [Nocardioides panzhihuensis]NYI78901.1 sorbitol/mannitol transport system substrate-binding protein [Nocardioides panzhihuensis]
MDPFIGAMENGCSKVENLTVKHSPVDFNAQLEKAQLSLSQDEGTYDIVEVYSGTLSQYAGEDWLYPLDEFYAEHGAEYDLDDIDPALLEFARYEGKIYVLPMMANVHVLTYRKDIFDELGIEPPETLDEMARAAKTIRDSGKMEHPLALTFSADADITTAYNNSLASLGGEWLDADSDKPLLTSSESVAAVQSLQKLVPYLPPDAMSANSVGVSTQMQTGDAAMTIMYTGSTAEIDSPEKSEFAGKFGFAAAPSVEPGGGPWATLNLDGFSIAKNSPVDHELLAQIGAAGTSADAAKDAGRLAFPARESVREDPELRAEAPHWEAAEATIEAGAHPYPAKPYFVPLQVAVRPFIADAVSGRLPVNEALEQAQRAAEKTIAQYR